MADLVRDHVRPGEVTAGAELVLQVAVEAEVQVDAPVGGAVERPDGGRGRAAAGVHAAPEQHELRSLVALTGPIEDLLPGLLGVREDVGAEVLEIPLRVLRRRDRHRLAGRGPAAAEAAVHVERGAAAAEELDRQHHQDAHQPEAAADPAHRHAAEPAAARSAPVDHVGIAHAPPLHGRYLARMRLCVMVEGQEGVTWEDWVALARATEEHGFEALFRSDHYGPVVASEELGSLDAWATLAGLAAVTSRIRLGTLVSPATFRHPSVFAKSAVTVDHISGGRVEVGLGAGWNESEHERYGFPFPPLRERMDAFAEQLEIVHRQWKGEPFSFEGEHYRLDRLGPAAEAGAVAARPPLIVGGSGKKRSVALAARWADEYNTVGAAPDDCREVASACSPRASGGPGSAHLLGHGMFVTGADRAELDERLRRLGREPDSGAIVGRPTGRGPAHRAGGARGGAGDAPAPPPHGPRHARAGCQGGGAEAAGWARFRQ